VLNQHPQMILPLRCIDADDVPIGIITIFQALSEAEPKLGANGRAIEGGIIVGAPPFAPKETSGLGKKATIAACSID
jgi:hypothetical protein